MAFPIYASPLGLSGVSSEWWWQLSRLDLAAVATLIIGKPNMGVKNEEACPSAGAVRLGSA